MATSTRGGKKSKSAESAEIVKLKQENAALKAKLTKYTADKKQKSSSFWRKAGAGLCAVLAVLSIGLWNISYWTRQTVLDTDQFVSTMQPLIKDPEIQKTLQTEITDQVFTRIDLEQELKKALPENVAFIAGPLTSQVKSFTYNKVGDVLNSDKAYDVWTKTLTTAHTEIIAYVIDPNNNGEITVAGIYKLAGENLGSSNIGFLLNKDLPSKVGSIKLAEVEGVPEARKAINTLDNVTTELAFASFIFTALAIGLSTRRRNMVVGIAVFTLLFFVATLAALEIGSTQISSSVDQRYSAAAEATYNIITSPLATQTKGVATFIAAVLLVAAVSSNWTSMVWIRTKARNASDWTLSRVGAKNLSAPSWLTWITENKVVIAWTLVAVSFAAFAVRIPPTTSGVRLALIVSAIVALILELLASFVRVGKK